MKSHLREEKNCLNCGVEISDRFCSHCGQENLPSQETTGHLIRHFFSDLTHYDSKFLVTLRDLLFKPGFLTQEYLQGRRIRYLNPVRMYIFISFLFFIVLFAQKTREEKTDQQSPAIQNVNRARQYLADSLKKSLPAGTRLSSYEKMRDSVVRTIAKDLDTIIVPVKKDESISFSISSKGFLFKLVETRYQSLHEYDSIQASLPVKERDGFIGRSFLRKNLSIKNRLGSRSHISVTEEFQHNVPKLMFILLPIFGLLLMLFYLRKKYAYAAHLLFSIHYHSFAFILLMLLALLNFILSFPRLDIALTILAVVILFAYLLIALKTFYRQSLFLSAVKAFVVSVLYLILLIVCLWIWALIIFFTS